MSVDKANSPTRPVFFSYQIGADRRAGEIDIHTGGPNASHAVRAKRFVELLRGLGHDPMEALRPEIHPAQDAASGGGTRAGRPIHLIFKPIEQIRVLRGAANIGVVSWPFDAITHEPVNKVPFSNQRRMLGLLDEIWVGSQHARHVLTRAGLPNVHVVPCPVPVPASPPAVRPEAPFLDGGKALRVDLTAGRGPAATS